MPFVDKNRQTIQYNDEEITPDDIKIDLTQEELHNMELQEVKEIIDLEIEKVKLQVNLVTLDVNRIRFKNNIEGIEQAIENARKLLLNI